MKKFKIVVGREKKKQKTESFKRISTISLKLAENLIELFLFGKNLYEFKFWQILFEFSLI